jgi:rod shape determining protein RodA
LSGRKLLDSLDLPTVLVMLALAGIGVFTIASATIEQPGHEGTWRMQTIWFLIALVAAAVIVAVDYRYWAETAYFLHGAVIVLLILVAFFGREVGGNRSWLVIGPLRLQPSELAKWSTCLVLAVYLSRRVRTRIYLRQFVEMGLLVAAPVALIALQPDMGTALIFVPIFLAALLIGGMPWKMIAALLLLGVLLMPVAWFQLKDYQKERILTVLDPGRDPSGYGYQVRQSKIAIGSGGLTGKGLFRGTQSQLNFLPAQHTDFALAVFVEELGFVGAATILALFYYLFHRGVLAARSAQDRLGTYLCLLVVAWIAGQMAINVGMVLGRLPTIGVPLPFISYGGSALLAATCGMALIVNVRSRRFVN